MAPDWPRAGPGFGSRSPVAGRQPHKIGPTDVGRAPATVGPRQRLSLRGPPACKLDLVEAVTFAPNPGPSRRQTRNMQKMCAGVTCQPARARGGRGAGRDETTVRRLCLGRQLWRLNDLTSCPPDTRVEADSLPATRQAQRRIAATGRANRFARGRPNKWPGANLTSGRIDSWRARVSP